ncbi:uridine kinase [Oryzobacter terrae]|uniref:uridine kinase n=1 Tax=Oryzobacter terrae TaxID=1620385 RepID=UPI003671BFC4
MLEELAAHLAVVRPGERAVVALDGVDGAGKTVLGRELATLLAPRREVHRVGVDAFHRPRTERYARGRTAEGFYRDSYDHRAIRDRLVRAFRAGLPWVHAVHDVELEVTIDPSPEPPAGDDALLLVDGVFLHRPELADLWDASVWVEVPFAVSVSRGNARFGAVGPEEGDPESATNARYVGGQRLYLEEVAPSRRATWVLDNADLHRPVLRSGES